MRTVRLRVKSNPGLVAMSNAHPGATFEVRGAWPEEEHLRLLVETDDVAPETLGETLEAVASIRDVRRRSPAREVARFEIATTKPAPHGAMADSGVVPAFPQTVEDGWIVGELTASGAQLRAFRDELADAGVEYQVASVRTNRGGEAVRRLTDRQREGIERAFDCGYYDVPRTATLTEVAAALDVDKSVASRLLRRAEGRLVADFLDEGGPPAEAVR